MKYVKKEVFMFQKFNIYFLFIFSLLLQFCSAVTSSYKLKNINLDTENVYFYYLCTQELENLLPEELKKQDVLFKKYATLYWPNLKLVQVNEDFLILKNGIDYIIKSEVKQNDSQVSYYQPVNTRTNINYIKVYNEPEKLNNYNLIYQNDEMEIYQNKKVKERHYLGLLSNDVKTMTNMTVFVTEFDLDYYYTVNFKVFDSLAKEFVIDQDLVSIHIAKKKFGINPLDVALVAASAKVSNSNVGSSVALNVGVTAFFSAMMYGMSKEDKYPIKKILRADAIRYVLMQLRENIYFMVQKINPESSKEKNKVVQNNEETLKDSNSVQK